MNKASSATERLIEREALFEKLFTFSPDAIVLTGAEGCIKETNTQLERLFGYSANELLGHPIEILIPERYSKSHLAHRRAYDDHPCIRPMGSGLELFGLRKDGTEFPVDIMLSPVETPAGRIVLGVIRDITERKQRDEDMRKRRTLFEVEMSHLAQHDVLTDLPNRLLLKDRLTQAISLARRNQTELVLLFLDLDGFKQVNDSLGHAIGDKLLQSVAARLSACVRTSDTVSRQGGDEFVILLSEVTHVADAAISAAKIITELKRPHRIGEHCLQITASIGLSKYPDDGEDAETLIKNADTAMYHAKEYGRDNYQFFSPDMSFRAAKRQSLEGQLRHALEHEELLLHYQPKINLKTGAITSVEALVRWQHPERGLLLPGQFLTIAEDTGMIVAIGQWVLSEACRQAQEWLDAGLLAVPVSVNISSLEFWSNQFLEGVRVALKNTRLDPKYLELELTETVLMRHAESAADTLEKLKVIGVRLAVDDFGTGYSSLSYLARFPIDAVKLDPSFIHDVTASSDNAIVVSAVIGMGKSLKHRVIAEGVETPEQLAFLQAYGCDEGQGHYFSRPLAAHQFAKLMETGLSAAVGD
jgi:diguanylate cyclase (GGDEF)-like protein/PAS domain S-box-containing protein